MESYTPLVLLDAIPQYLLYREARKAGVTIIFTGEGADEALDGYPWHKAGKVFSLLDSIGLANRWRKRFMGRAGRKRLPWSFYQQRYRRLGGYHAMGDLYSFCGLSGVRLFSDDLLEQTYRAGLDATADLEIPTAGCNC